MMITQEEQTFLSQLNEKTGKTDIELPSLFVIVDYAEVLVTENEKATVYYLDHDFGDGKRYTLHELKKMVKSSQRWRFERMLMEQGLDDINWNNDLDMNKFNEQFDYFAVHIWNMEKIYISTVPTITNTFFSRTHAEEYLVDRRSDFHDMAHVEKRHVDDSATIELLRLLHKVAAENNVMVA